MLNINILLKFRLYTVSRILFISDLHFTARLHEQDQEEWLMALVDDIKPDVLISAGD